RELAGAASIGEEAEVADAPKALGQDVQEEPAHELVGVERHRLRLVAGAIVFPSEVDATVLAIEETAVGDCDAMRIAAEIVENLLRSAAGAFGVDDPVDAAKPRKMLGEC